MYVNTVHSAAHMRVDGCRSVAEGVGDWAAHRAIFRGVSLPRALAAHHCNDPDSPPFWVLHWCAALPSFDQGCGLTFIRVLLLRLKMGSLGWGRAAGHVRHSL